jgi:hypothetical protein
MPLSGAAHISLITFAASVTRPVSLFDGDAAAAEAAATNIVTTINPFRMVATLLRVCAHSEVTALPGWGALQELTGKRE